MTKHDIFSTPLWHIGGAPQQLIDELYEEAYRFKKKYKTDNRTNQGGYQTPPLDWKDFHPQGKEYIKNVINNNFKEHALLWPYWNIQEWWYNINPKGSFNLVHSHPGADLALVLYITEGDGLLSFMNPFPQRQIEKNNHYLSSASNKGDIIIFPADLLHFVLPNIKEEDRISISMNIKLDR